MRILHKNVSAKRILFNPVTGIIYFLCFLYFLQLNFKLIQIFFQTEDNLLKVKEKYEKKLQLQKTYEKDNFVQNTEEGKKRWTKETFNQLEEGEKLIILYDEKQENDNLLEINRNLNTFEQLRLKWKLWLANFN